MSHNDGSWRIISTLESEIQTNMHKPSNSYDPIFEKYLIRLGVYPILIFDDCHIDKALIFILINRWRSEISTFNLSV
jgi:hypothetical protein